MLLGWCCGDGVVGMVLCCMDDDDTILPCAGKTLQLSVRYLLRRVALVTRLTLHTFVMYMYRI